MRWKLQVSIPTQLRYLLGPDTAQHHQTNPAHVCVPCQQQGFGVKSLVNLWKSCGLSFGVKDKGKDKQHQVISQIITTPLSLFCVC